MQELLVDSKGGKRILLALCGAATIRRPRQLSHSGTRRCISSRATRRGDSRPRQRLSAMAPRTHTRRGSSEPPSSNSPKPLGAHLSVPREEPDEGDEIG
jgi:hypothetical protein